jgi:hypothetical protein
MNKDNKINVLPNFHEDSSKTVPIIMPRLPFHDNQKPVILPLLQEQREIKPVLYTQVPEEQSVKKFIRISRHGIMFS